MPNTVYKKVEIVGTSPVSISEAINDAIGTAAQSIDHIGWFEVQEIRGNIQDGKVSQYQVSLKLGFRVDSGSSGD